MAMEYGDHRAESVGIETRVAVVKQQLVDAIQYFEELGDEDVRAMAEVMKSLHKTCDEHKSENGWADLGNHGL